MEIRVKLGSRVSQLVNMQLVLSVEQFFSVLKSPINRRALSIPGTHACMLSRDQLFVTLWTAACQDPLSMGFSRQEYWSGLLCPFLGDLPDPRIKPTSLASPALADGFFTTLPPGKCSKDLILIVPNLKITRDNQMCPQYISKSPMWLLSLSTRVIIMNSVTDKIHDV